MRWWRSTNKLKLAISTEFQLTNLGEIALQPAQAGFVSIGAVSTAVSDPVQSITITKTVRSADFSPPRKSGLKSVLQTVRNADFSPPRKSGLKSALRTNLIKINRSHTLTQI